MMRAIVVWITIWLAGCGGKPAASADMIAPPPEPPPITAPQPTISPRAGPEVVASIRGQYHAAAQQELAKALAPAVTPDYATRLLEADRAVRAALTAAERQGRHVSEDALRVAREAVARLNAVVLEDPE